MLGRTEAAALQQQVEALLMAFDPNGPQGVTSPLRPLKRRRQCNAFGEVDRQLRLLGSRLLTTLTDEELAQDMSTARPTVEVGLRDLQRDLGNQRGLQVTAAIEGATVAAKQTVGPWLLAGSSRPGTPDCQPCWGYPHCLLLAPWRLSW